MLSACSKHRETLQAGLLFLLLAFAAYYPALGNFFTWDDFLWLYRAKNLPGAPLQAFNIDAVYFDPLVYLWFWIDFNLHGLNYFWYHLADIAVHAINALFVYLIVARLSQDRFAALAGGIIFVSSFAVADAVVWSSSRVDLLAVCFSLLTILCFLNYLDSNAKAAIPLATVTFILALGAKGTPLLLPLLLGVILLQRGELGRHWRLLLPFLLTSILYLSLLAWRLSATGKTFMTKGGSGLNLRNVAISIVELFVPERFFAPLNVWFLALVFTVLIGLCCYFLTGGFGRTAIFGVTLLILGLAPVLIINDFKVAGSVDNVDHLLNSASHRIYLASAGSASMLAVFVTAALQRFKKRSICYALLLLIVSCNIYEIRLRTTIWSGFARYIRGSVEGITVYNSQLLDDSTIGMVNFPMSRGFIRPALALYCGLERVLLLPMAAIPQEMLDSPEILRYRKRGFFFVYDGSRVVDLSRPFAQLLDASFLFQVSQNDRERAQLMSNYNRLADEINSTIDAANKRNPMLSRSGA